MTVAMQKNHNAILKELLLTGEVNVNTKDDEGRTLLALSMNNINIESVAIIKELLSQKSKVDVNS